MSPSTTSTSSSKPERVCIVGSGNWGSAISKIAGRNILAHPDKFERKLPMWVFEEELEDGGGKLTEVINEKHENVK
jgi:glycerol-3-phosphate dehydrogenase (NAD+)